MTSLNQIDQPAKSKRNSNTGSIKKSPSGNWELRYYVADQSGNRKRVSTTVKGSKKNAQAKLREVLSAVDNGSYVDKSQETVTQFADRWMHTYVATNCTLRTAKGYQGNVDRYILPAIGRVAVQNLTTGQIQSIYAAMLARGLSRTTVLHVHRVLKQILGYAVKCGVISKNAADGATPPKRAKKQSAMWDVPTIHQFLEGSQDSRYGPIFKFALTTGMRRSEICGLKWDAVDLFNGSLDVAATLQQIRGHGLVTGEPKTERSRRTIKLAPETVELLREVDGEQIWAREKAGPLWKNTGYVFTQADGSPVLPDTLTQEFRFLVKALELPPLNLHGLRHAFATLGLVGGMAPKTVSEHLGHSSIVITLDLYSHVLPSMQEELVNVVANLLKFR
jgi:integrase